MPSPCPYCGLPTCSPDKLCGFVRVDGVAPPLTAEMLDQTTRGTAIDRSDYPQELGEYLRLKNNPDQED